MGKALILKNGVDFSANAVATIEFADIPCTGITFAQNTYTVSGYNAVTVEYTVTPADTTDSVIWLSSNTDIVSISNGVMTVNGVGTCTITATCGEFTATATVTVSIACTPNWEFRNITSNNDFVSYGNFTYNRLLTFGVGAQASTHNMPSIGDNVADSPYAIKIPKNTAKIRVSRGADKGSSFYNNSTSQFICWMQDVACGDSSFPDAAKRLSRDDFNPVTNASTEFTIPTDADCFVISMRTQTTYTAEDDANTVASTLGLTIEFIPAE